MTANRPQAMTAMIVPSEPHQAMPATIIRNSAGQNLIVLAQTGVEATSEETLSVWNDLAQTDPENRALVLELCTQTEHISLSDNHMLSALSSLEREEIKREADGDDVEGIASVMSSNDLNGSSSATSKSSRKRNATIRSLFRTWSF